MGMAASQVRFLSLQNRKNTIGLNLMTLSNKRTALTRDMNRVAAEYNDAMNQKILKWSSDSGITYHDLSYDLLMKPNNINATKPYILTDAQGRVVLDDKPIIVDGKEQQYSYRDLATLISTYSGSTEGKANYNNTSNVTGIDAGATINAQVHTLTNKAESGAPSVGVGYTIPTDFESYNYKNSLRYDLMVKLGLVSETEQATVTGMLNEIYGNEQLQPNLSYSSVLSTYDTSKANGAETYGAEYSEVFGALVINADSIEINGGCAMGNLALAQAYLKEYQAYLNTGFKKDIIADTTATLMTSTESDISKIDAGNSDSSMSPYAYDADKNVGVSTRMADLLIKTGGAEKQGNNFNIKLDSILNNLTVDYERLKTEVSGDRFVYDADNIGNFGELNDFNKMVTLAPTWGKLFDMDGGLDGGKSYDKDGDGYFTGLDYIGTGEEQKDEDGNKLAANKGNDTTGVSYVIRRSDDRKNKTENMKQLTKVVGIFKDSMSTVEGINKAGLDYAEKMTIQLYNDNYKHQYCGDGDDEATEATRNAGDEAGEIFGFSSSKKYGNGPDVILLNFTNVMNTFITFYEMYMAVNGNENLIKGSEGSTKTYKEEITDAYTCYKTDIAEDLKTGNPLNRILSDWLVTSDGQTVEKGTASTDANNITTLTYTKKTTDEDGSTKTSTATVQGSWNGTSFSSVKSIKIDNGDVTTEYEYSADATGSSRSIKQTTTDNKEGQTYKISYNYNGVETIGKIEMDTPLDVDGTKVKTINITDNEITSCLDKSGNQIKQDKLQSASYEYYIVGEDGTEDKNYKYKLIGNSPKHSVFASTITLKPIDTMSEKLNALVTKCQDRVTQLTSELNNYYESFENKGMDYFDALFKMISENGWVYDGSVNTDDQVASREYLNAKLQNNMYFITEVETMTGSDYSYATKIAQNVPKMFQVYDKDAQNVALSEYEAEKAEITSKEKQLDIRMNKLEAEQDAIKTELDSLKKIIDDNVQNTFKIFT